MIHNQLLEPLHLGTYLQSGAIQVQSGAILCTQEHSGAYLGAVAARLQLRWYRYA